MASSLSAAAVSAIAAPRGGAALSATMRSGGAAGLCVGQLSSFGGLKAHNGVSSLGQRDCVDRSFARIVSSLRPAAKGTGKGGASSSTCNAAEEIFRIASIMCGLVLVGVAVGFVLLRVEAWVEESEAAE